MIGQLSDTGQSLLNQIRKDLAKAAEREPSAQPFIPLLDKQLANFAKGDADDRAALRPEIEKSIRKIAARDGR